jgi:hypothetical protein
MSELARHGAIVASDQVLPPTVFRPIIHTVALGW